MSRGTADAIGTPVRTCSGRESPGAGETRGHHEENTMRILTPIAVLGLIVGKAATTGDFVLTADEVNPVIKAMQSPRDCGPRST